MHKTLSTSDVPSQFLQATYLTGHTPLKALDSDPRVSYALYIPPKKYDTTSDPIQLPLVILVHGTRRKITALYAEDVVSFANSTPCAILAPLFPSGLDGPNDLDSYKTLRSKSLSSDLAIVSMVEEVAARWPGVRTDKFSMMGFSGGGQFTQRFLYLYPEKLLAVSVGSPGRTTMLHLKKPWPEGVADVETLFDRPFRKELIQQVPIQLAVGSADDQVHGSEEFWNWLELEQMKRKKDKDGQNEELQRMRQGRLQTIRDLKEAWEREGISCQLTIVDGVSHEGEKMRPHMLRFLRPFIQARFHKLPLENEGVN